MQEISTQHTNSPLKLFTLEGVGQISAKFTSSNEWITPFLNPIVKNIYLTFFTDGTVQAHRLILAAASKFLRDILMDSLEEEETVLLIPDVKKVVLTALMDFLYTVSIFVFKGWLSNLWHSQKKFLWRLLKPPPLIPRTYTFLVL